jgi:hypothetical protein
MGQTMIKRLVVSGSVLLLVLAQAYIIYGVQQGGDQFVALWSGFGVRQTDYSRFVFRTIRWWWGVPALTLMLMGLALLRSRLLFAAAAATVALLGTVALYWSVYGPALWIDL